ncbi:MAG: hypothetical protein V4465_01885 [Patescibacteria group bacterium]
MCHVLINHLPDHVDVSEKDMENIVGAILVTLKDILKVRESEIWVETRTRRRADILPSRVVALIMIAWSDERQSMFSVLSRSIADELDRTLPEKFADEKFFRCRVLLVPMSSPNI